MPLEVVPLSFDMNGYHGGQWLTRELHPKVVLTAGEKSAQVAHKSRWDPLAGPALRARTAGWLWLGPTTLVPAIQHTNALLREFALGGGPSADAALLLLEALPQEFLSLLARPVGVSPPCTKHAVVIDLS